ncbi:hypothetical protein C8R47DRAFT_1104293 [Mycena vitilis]|nr:hypothetical protein C8R47DRAFT_1104293 [Mycena vitilis]
MPGQLTVNPHKAGVSLRVVVVGGGIAGIATAFTLQRAGHSVTVLDRSDGTARSHGGLRSPPNMTRILNQWDLGPVLAKTAVKCPQFRFHAADGEPLALWPLYEDFMRDLMAEFLFIQHGDLQSMILDLATRAGVEFRYNAPVASVDCGNVSITLEDGECIYADLVVGADGPDSLVRTEILGKRVAGVPDGNMSLTMSIPVDEMCDDDDLRPLTEDDNWWVWLGPDTMFHGSLIAGRKEFSVVIGLDNVPVETLAKYDESWDKLYPIEHFGIDWSAYDVRVQKLMKLARQVTPTVHLRRPLLESVVCEHARIVIVGQAAHPIVPAGQHNTALALEDAEMLGALFARIQHRAQIPRLLSAHEEMRQPRGTYAQGWELRKRALLTFPTGAHQQARDARLRRMMSNADSDSTHVDEKRFREMWGDEVDMFSYSATEKGDDWWTKWGGLLAQRESDEVPLKPTPVEVNVSSGPQRMHVY